VTRGPSNNLARYLQDQSQWAISAVKELTIFVMGAETSVVFLTSAKAQLPYGYAVTSHSSQGQTADRVLVHVDTEQAGEKLVNRRLAYVAVSRSRYDAQLYTNDAAKLSEALSRDVSKYAALDVEVNRIHVQGAQFAVKQPSPSNIPQGEQMGRAQAHGQSVGQGGGSQGQS
jgi:UvrD-like helicase C-terminal domain